MNNKALEHPTEGETKQANRFVGWESSSKYNNDSNDFQ